HREDDADQDGRERPQRTPGGARGDVVHHAEPRTRVGHPGGGGRQQGDRERSRAGDGPAAVSQKKALRTHATLRHVGRHAHHRPAAWLAAPRWSTRASAIAGGSAAKNRNETCTSACANSRTTHGVSSTIPMA